MKRILIWGNTIFTQAIVQTLYESKQFIITVLTGNSSFNPVIQYCTENDITIFIPDEDDWYQQTNNFLNNNNFDLNIVIAYGKIIPDIFLNIPKYGSINIHGSLLPKLRGATPIQSALLNGFDKTGVTMQKMIFQMDAGDILKQLIIPVHIQDNYSILRQNLIEITCQNIIDFLNQYFENKIIPTPQIHSEASYCKIKDFSKQKGKINWEDKCLNIHNKIRAFYPEPIAWTTFPINKTDKTKFLNVLSSKPTKIKSVNIPGTMFFTLKKTYVSSLDYDLEITGLVLEGKKQMDGEGFGNGWIQKRIINLGL